MESKQRREDPRVILCTSSYLPAREGNRPYRLDTCEGTRPRQTYYDTYNEMFAAIERANPGTTAREA